nr:hypothetical protein [Rhodococcus sp. (in: high G+C Gram-positive bacteria)]
MSDPGRHRGQDPEFRPQPARPEFAVEPLRPREEPSSSSTAHRVCLLAWAGVAIVALALAAVVALRYDAVRAALETTVAQDSSGASTSAVSDTVTVTLLGSAAVTVVLLLVAGFGLSLAAARKPSSTIVLLVAGLLTIGASIAFWSFMSDAGSVAAGALRWGPLVAAGLAAVATVAAATMRTK